MIFIAQCFRCARLDREGIDNGLLVCAAFPNGVPDDILFNKFRHTSAYPGDNGILFEKRPVPENEDWDRPVPDDWGPDFLLEDEA